MSRRKIKTGSFKAQDESGNLYTVLEYTEQVDATDGDSTSTEWLDVQRELRLQSGENVNRISDTEYLVVQTQTSLTRI